MNRFARQDYFILTAFIHLGLGCNGILQKLAQVGDALVQVLYGVHQLIDLGGGERLVVF